jgi:hypothetical protein
MRTQIRYFPMLFAAAGACAAVVMAPIATASPQCTTTAPNTTQCQTKGSTAIVTSPQQNGFYGGWPWWGGGGIVIGIGGWGW